MTDRVPSTIHIDAKGQVSDPKSHQRLDLSQPQFSEIQTAMQSQGSSGTNWEAGDYRLENGRLVPTSGS